MTTTQIKPVGSGSYANVNRDSTNKATKTQTPGVTLAAHQTSLLCQFLNEWTNCAGTGPHATAAQKRLHALGIQVAEN